MTNKALYTNVSIKKTGYTEVMPGQQIRYDFSNIANNSTTIQHIVLLGTQVVVHSAVLTVQIGLEHDLVVPLQRIPPEAAGTTRCWLASFCSRGTAVRKLPHRSAI